MHRRPLVMLTCGWVAVAAAAGCTGSTAALDADAAAIDGASFLLAEEPAGAIAVGKLRAELPSDETIAVLGRIGGIDNPWTIGEASFVICDPSLDRTAAIDRADGDDDPNRDTRADAQLNSMAFVQIVDRSGRVVRVDARKLLDLREDQRIVVLGRASLNRAGHMVIAAGGLYVVE